MKRIYLSPPHLSGNEMSYIQEAFEGNWIAPVGKNLDEFEKKLAEYVGLEGAVALNSGTAAIHLALKVLDIQPGDEVICSSLTFIASANPIIYCGATPVFVDSEALTWNMSPTYLEQAIEAGIKRGNKAKAIILVHLYGMPALLHEIMEIAAHYQIPVIEDAAEALGALYRGKKVGSFGMISTLSFNGNKIITTSAGGAMLSDHETYTIQAKYLSQQAKMPFQNHYEHEEIGYNYRLSNILAGIGLGQLGVLEERVQRKREIYQIYKEELFDIPAISFQDEPDYMRSSYWLTGIRIDKRSRISPERLNQFLEKENIESRFFWKPLHTQPALRDRHYYYGGNTALHIFEEGLCIPSGTGMSNEELERVIECIKKIF